MASEGRPDAARRAVALVSLAAAAILLVHSVLWDLARYHHGTFLARPADLVTIGTGKASVFRLSLVADMLGDYLLFIPAVIYLWRSFRADGGNEVFVDVVAAAGLAFAVVGATAAAVLAFAGEPLIRTYAHASNSADRHQVALVFRALIDASIAVWQVVGAVLGGVWFVGVGILLRGRRKWFARFSLVFGAVFVLGAAGKTAGISYDSSGPAKLAFFPIVLWIGWLGLILWSPQATGAEALS